MQNVYINKSARICLEIRLKNAQYQQVSVSDFHLIKAFRNELKVLKKVKYQMRKGFTTILVF